MTVEEIIANIESVYIGIVYKTIEGVYLVNKHHNLSSLKCFYFILNFCLELHTSPPLSAIVNGVNIPWSPEQQMTGTILMKTLGILRI